jgi:cell division protein FtsW
MYGYDTEKINQPVREDILLAACVLLMTGLGIATLYSSSFAYAARFFGDGLYFVTRQIVFGGAGLLLFLAASRINLDFVRRLVKLLVAVTLVLCVLTLIPGIQVVRK